MILPFLNVKTAANSEKPETSKEDRDSGDPPSEIVPPIASSVILTAAMLAAAAGH
jgi:hypothetical protein